MLGSHELCVYQIHLLRWNGFFEYLRRFSRRWGFPLNVVQRILVVRLEFRVFEFPRLWMLDLITLSCKFMSPLTPAPYGDCPLSSLLCRTLWKSYLFSCLTKLAKLLCLKCFGRIDLVNRSFCSPGQRYTKIVIIFMIPTSSTTKLSPSSPQRTTEA